jgi:beta-phosphoglucomutase
MIRGVIFDLDGVLVITDELHYQSWNQVTRADGIAFDRKINERLRGLTRSASLEIVLERSGRPYTAAEKLALAERKNDVFRKLAERLTPADLLPGAMQTVAERRRRGIKTAIGSSSKNTRLIAEHLGIRDQFDTIVDGNDISRSKPDPEVFLRVAQRLGLRPDECLVIEDAVAGVESARRAGMAVFGIGSRETLSGVERVAADLTRVAVDDLIALA